MAEFRIQAMIRRPVEDVFRVLTDVEMTERWFPARVHEHWTSAPPHGVGSTRHAVVSMMGRRNENDATVTEFDPPRRAVLAGEQSGMRWTVALDFRPVGDATRVVLDFGAEASGALGIALRPFLWWYRRAWQRGLGDARRHDGIRQPLSHTCATARRADAGGPTRG